MPDVDSGGTPIGMMSAFSTTSAWGEAVPFPVTMRKAPAVAVSDPGHFEAYVGSAKTLTAISFLQGSTRAVKVGSITTSDSFVIGDCVMVYFKAAGVGWIEADAEM